MSEHVEDTNRVISPHRTETTLDTERWGTEIGGRQQTNAHEQRAAQVANERPDAGRGTAQIDDDSDAPYPTRLFGQKVTGIIDHLDRVEQELWLRRAYEMALASVKHKTQQEGVSTTGPVIVTVIVERTVAP